MAHKTIGQPVTMYEEEKFQQQKYKIWRTTMIRLAQDRLLPEKLGK